MRRMEEDRERVRLRFPDRDVVYISGTRNRGYRTGILLIPFPFSTNA